MATVIVTGASRGLGRAVAQDLARRGATVVAAARSADDLAALAATSDRIHAVAGDLTDPDARRAVVDRALDLGGIDALVNDAGMLEPLARLADADPEAWTANLDINLVTPVALTALALPALRTANGRVVNVSSGVAKRPVVGWGAYCTAKAALLMATRVLTEEEDEVTAVSVRPGVVDTEMQAAIRAAGQDAMTDEAHDRFVGLHESGELLDPAVPAASVAVLALHAPPSMSGAFVSWDDDEVRALDR